MKRISFSAPMIRAVLAGDKTQTRRVISNSVWMDHVVCDLDVKGGRPVAVIHSEAFEKRCPLSYAVGDKLAVIEEWRTNKEFDPLPPRLLPPDAAIQYLADGTISNGSRSGLKGRRRWSQHMPVWASRETIRVVDLRLQRLSEISREDAMAEGIVEVPEWDGDRFRVLGLEDDRPGFLDPVEAFADLWDGLNASRGFGFNMGPFVAAYTFEMATVAAYQPREGEDDAEI